MSKKSIDPKRRWKFISKFDAGGQSILYEVSDLRGEYAGRCVRKVLNNPIRIDRFKQEILIMERLFNEGHKVAQIIDSYTAGESPYYVMPMYVNGNLRHLMERNRTSDNLVQCLDIVEELYFVIWKAHENGVAHRDLKPENILFDGDNNVILCDFGLGRNVDESSKLTLDDEQVGSRHYIAPEALAGCSEDSDPKLLDAYSFGKIAYEIAAGKLLPGLKSPDGKFDLGILHNDDIPWGMFNQLITGLVSSDLKIRKDTWIQIGSQINKIRRMMHKTVPEGFEHMYEKALAQINISPRFTEAVSSIERDKTRSEFSDSLITAFNRAVDNHVNYQQIISNQKITNVVDIYSHWIDDVSWRTYEVKDPSFPIGGGGIRGLPRHVSMHKDGYFIRVVLDARWNEENMLDIRLVSNWTTTIGEQPAPMKDHPPKILKFICFCGDVGMINTISQQVPDLLDDWSINVLSCINIITKID